jgi:hypothetical protein
MEHEKADPACVEYSEDLEGDEIKHCVICCDGWCMD